ncbi:hypothetical protein C8R44DRAFT_861232 [Mycena epipterygia]|nr:hypothetical protein C8R44DRAFT_861232 [Mycena epipterygia]
MSRMPHSTNFRLELFLGVWTEFDILNAEVPPITSNITSLSMEVGDHFEASDCIQALNELLPSLALPHLHELTFQSAEYPYAVMHWSQTGFLALGARSSFHTHLQSLRLCHVVITEAALLETLSTLPLLQQLEIADHELAKDQGANHLLITDSLLTALTLTPTPSSLVPQLRSLICQSTLQFNDHVYLEFLLSRCRAQSSDLPPFVSELQWLPDHHRKLAPVVSAYLRELRINNELLVVLSEADL